MIRTYLLALLVCTTLLFALYYAVDQLECLVDDVDALREEVLQQREEEANQNVSEYDSANDDTLMSDS